MKTVWNQLKQSYQDKIRKAAHRFNTAKRLKYTLMASDGWYNLQLDTIRTLLMFTDKHSFDVSGTDIMYGTEFLKEESND